MKRGSLLILIILITVLLLFVACQKTGNIVKKTTYKAFEPKKGATIVTPKEEKPVFKYDSSCASKYCCTMDQDRNCLKCCDSIQKSAGENTGDSSKKEGSTNYVSRLSSYLKKLFSK